MSMGQNPEIGRMIQDPGIGKTIQPPEQGLKSTVHNEPGIGEKLLEAEGLVSMLEETQSLIYDKLHPVINTKPSPAPSTTQDIPLQSPIFMRLSTLNMRIKSLIESQQHLLGEIEL